MKTYFIYNPISGNHSKHKRDVLLKLISSNPENIILTTKNKNDEKMMTEKAIQMDAEKIIAIGGDGTLNKVASVLTGTNVVFGMIPLGSGNGLARHLGIPMVMGKALDRALNGTRLKIDACKINDRLFFCTAGFGFDATVAEIFDNRGKRGLINYIIAVIIALFKYRSIEVETASGEIERLFMMTIANANQFGNNAFISPYSNIQDGTFEIIKIKKTNLLMLLMISIRLFLKNIHRSGSVEIISSKSFRMKYKAGQPMHIDGESLKTNSTNLEIDILQGALNVIA